MKSFFSVLLTGLFVLGFSLGAKAESTIAQELDGKYIYLAPDENFKISRFEISIKDGQISFPGDHDSLKNIQIERGAQGDFIATLKSKLPPGLNFYKIEADIQGSGEKLKITLMTQRMNESNPRLSLYAVSEGKPMALMHGFAEDQKQALEDEEKRINQ